ncbi:unnamed protein product, partial [Prorocentrum cordatum]
STALAPGTPTVEELGDVASSEQKLAYSQWWPRDAAVAAGSCSGRFVVPPEAPAQPTGFN